VAKLLSEEAERRGLLSDGQFGSRKQLSAIAAAAIMFDRAHAAWRNGHITGVRLMDIEAAFPSMAEGRLVNLMKIRKMDGDLLRWTESFLLKRMVEMIIEHQQKIFPSGRTGSVRVEALRQSRQRHPGGGLLRARRQFNASRSISPSDRCFTVSSHSVGLLF